MTLKDMETALEADWENVVAFFHNLFHKAAAPASPPVEVAPAVVVADPVVTPPAVNPTEGSLGVGATDPNYIDPRFPNGTQATGPSYDPSKTVLDASDFGHLFFPPVGTTTYTITGPAKISLVIDGTETLGEYAKGQIDGGTVYTVGFGVPDAVAGGVLDTVGDGQHSFQVTHDVKVGRVGVEITQA